MTAALSGIKPTGTLHLGNYLGMIRPALALARQTARETMARVRHAIGSGARLDHGDERRRELARRRTYPAEAVAE